MKNCRNHFEIALNKIKILIRNFFYLWTILIVFSVSGQESDNIIIGTKHTIVSNILREDRTYQLYLPDSYAKSSKTYPVILLLDGDYHFHSATGIVQYLSNDGEIPEMIVVAVPNTDRNRDFTPSHSLINYVGDTDEKQKTTGGAEKFLDFLEQELLKEIDSKYRTNKYRILVGHSMGGELSTYAFLSPERSFNAHIAIDPSFWWDDQYIIKKIDSSIIKKIVNKKIYISTADNYERSHFITRARTSQELFYALLKNNGMPYKNCEFEYFEQENHITVPILSLYHGLYFLFKDFVLEDVEFRSAEEIADHYQKLSDDLGIAFLPPENMINNVAYYKLYGGKDRENALKLLKMSLSYYPDSAITYEILGEAYKLTGENKKALEYYQKSYELDPSNESVAKTIRELKNK
ncbi:tetratricopeptide repeat protein [Sinomicrobium pectinilyticum]|uniref:Tetratricopeptide repeat protein n=1 Tax=Sinomicrobium pectinilyticum TaxID=1084421 RepID=A0A3N0ELI0_SINP1|nr:alpha/beta hydrolase-fold protein [Sinomicrobium pectinilyticum]RNL88529.1 tetratricopeptide repeat protein [Sinomicrobium pectinilyticum]